MNKIVLELVDFYWKDKLEKGRFIPGTTIYKSRVQALTNNLSQGYVMALNLKKDGVTNYMKLLKLLPKFETEQIKTQGELDYWFNTVFRGNDVSTLVIKAYFAGKSGLWKQGMKK